MHNYLERSYTVIVEEQYNTNSNNDKSKSMTEIVISILAFLGIAIPAYLTFVVKSRQHKFDLQKELEEEITRKKEENNELKELIKSLEKEMKANKAVIENQSNLIKVMDSEAANALEEVRQASYDYFERQLEAFKKRFNLTE